MDQTHHVAAIIPCNDLDASEAFYARLGFARAEGSDDPGYRILSDGQGGHIHLSSTVAGWVVPSRNAFGVYVYAEDVDRLAAAFSSEIIAGTSATDTPWGMYEFAVSDPNGTLVRVGWPSHQRPGQ